MSSNFLNKLNGTVRYIIRPKHFYDSASIDYYKKNVLLLERRAQNRKNDDNYSGQTW